MQTFLNTCAMSPDHRIDPREAVSLPVQLDGGSVGMTRDISASGVFLETGFLFQDFWLMRDSRQASHTRQSDGGSICGLNATSHRCPSGSWK